MDRKTTKIELVETHNLAVSLTRLQEGAKNGYDDLRWRRALYHALAMTRACPTYTMLQKIREVLELA